MNAEQTLSILDRLGISSLDEIQRFRKVAIALAISGKFGGDITQISIDDWADSETLSSLGIKPSALPILPDQLPEHFHDPTKFVRLGAIADIEKGKTAITKARPGPFPMVVTGAERKPCDHYDFEGPAAIIPLVSSTGHGRASINRLHYQEGQFALGTILAAVFPKAPKLFSARFLFEYLSTFTDELLVSRMTGTANVTLTVGRISDVPIPIIDPDVQRRIDELMTLCDRLEETHNTRETTRNRLTTATLTRLTAPDTDNQSFRNHARFALDTLPALTARPDQIKTLRQTILNLAVRGKLVEQDPADEPASELLERIATDQAQLVKARKIRKSKPTGPIGPEEVANNIPEGWECLRLGAVIDLLSGQHLQPSEYSADSNSGIPYITGPSDFSNKGLRINRYALVRKAVAHRGQLLLTVKGSGVGKTAFCDLPKVAISRQLMALTPIGWNPKFLNLVTHRLAGRLQQQARSLIPGISRSDVENFDFLLPPLAEQERIVKKVDELMALCDRLEVSLNQADTKRSRLLESLLAETLASTQEEREAA